MASLTLALACSGDATGPAAPDLPAAARFVTSDIDHFWAAYDAGGKTGDASAFQTRYLDSASAGLRDFVRARTVTAASLVAMVTTYPRVAAIRANTIALSQDRQTLDRIRAGFERIDSLYRPGDLGYFIGYRIARACYLKATDKRAALREIIEVSDAAAFLAASGYQG